MEELGVEELGVVGVQYLEAEPKDHDCITTAPMT